MHILVLMKLVSIKRWNDTVVKSTCCSVMKPLDPTGDSQTPVTIAARNAIPLLASVGTHPHTSADTYIDACIHKHVN